MFWLFVAQQAQACDVGALECSLHATVATPGGPNVLMLARVVNNGATSCDFEPRPSLGTEAPSVTIVGTNPSTVIAAGDTYEFSIELQVAATTDATIGKTVNFNNSPDKFPCAAPASQYLCIIPSGERTFDSAFPPAASGLTAQGNSGWGLSLERQTVHAWGIEVLPTTANFTGREIQEFAAEIPIDECWWTSGPDPANPIERASLSGLETTIQNNSYAAPPKEWDWVGWKNSFVNFYRGLHPAPYNLDVTPCHALVPQEMQMKCYKLPTGVYWAPYKTNDQVIGNNELCGGAASTPWVSSQRDTECSPKYWP
jgi:hypothetical protein